LGRNHSESDPLARREIVYKRPIQPIPMEESIPDSSSPRIIEREALRIQRNDHKVLVKIKEEPKEHPQNLLPSPLHSPFQLQTNQIALQRAQLKPTGLNSGSTTAASTGFDNERLSFYDNADENILQEVRIPTYEDIVRHSPKNMKETGPPLYDDNNATKKRNVQVESRVSVFDTKTQWNNQNLISESARSKGVNPNGLPLGIEHTTFNEPGTV
jgi:hypothetical protein